MADLRVRLTPRADRDAVGGVREDGIVPVRVTAPPVDGKANAALCKLLAKRLGVPPSRIEVIRGQSSRDKTVRVVGGGDAEAHERLSG